MNKKLKRSMMGVLATTLPGLTVAPVSYAVSIEEVVVTAQKREQNLQDVALAVSAYSGEMLEKSQIFDVSDLATRTPAFSFQTMTPMESELIIRGIGTIRLDSASADSSVAVFQDETYIGRRGVATTDFFDLERIEILRGPQGTLYGKNVVGGAVNVYSAAPEFDPSGKIKIGYGNYDTSVVSGHITGGLNDNTAGRISVHSRNRREGFAYNRLRNEELETLEAYAIRGQLLNNLSDTMTLHVRADASHDRSGGQARHQVDDPFRPGLGPVSEFLQGTSIRDSFAPFSQGLDREVYGLSATLDWETSIGNFKSITAWRSAEATNALDQVGAPAPPSIYVSLVTEYEDYRALSQEFRLASPDSSELQWVVGAYFLREDTDRTDGQIEYSPQWEQEGPGGLGDLLTGQYLYEQTNETTNYALFGQVTWPLSESLSVTGGARYTIDEKDYRTKATDLSNDNGTRGATPLLEGFDWVEVDEQWSEFTPRVALEWRAQDNMLLYASASKGFKGGGWQGKPATAAGAVISYDPETAWNYEAGIKSDWFDQRLRVNAAAFFIDYEGLQLQQTNSECLCLVVDNAANAESAGIELEMQALLNENVLLWLSGSYLDNEYIDFIDDRGNDFSGNFMQRTPESQFTIGGEYTVQVADRGEVSLRVDYAWQDEIFWTPNNTTFEDAYGLLGSRLSFVPAGSSYEVALWGKNLTDEEFRTRAGPVLGDESSTWGAPRTYGIEFIMNFD